MFGAIRKETDARWYLAVISVLVLAAWGVLALWDASPFGGLLGHSQFDKSDFSWFITFAIFMVGWILMTIAMMLPGSMPLIHLFQKLVQRRENRFQLNALLILGYLGVWALFGGLAFSGDFLLHEGVERSIFLSQHAEIIGAGLLLVAGIYQFTPLKEKCLTECRSPYSFLSARWHGKSLKQESFRLGAEHGWFCLGCCWTLMLLMFALGGVNFGWMLGLGAVMAMEKSARWGRYLTRPIGVALFVWGVLFLVGFVAFPGAA